MLSSCLVAKATLGLALGLLWRLHVVLGLPSLEIWQAMAIAATHRFPFNAGTGFFVNAHGDFVSAAHLIGDCPLPAVQTPNGLVVGRTIALSSDGDVAVMATPFQPRSFATLPSYVDGGWRSAVIARFSGCGGESSYSLVEATAIDTLRHLPGLLPVVADQPIVGGNSGSPVIDTQGSVIGVLVARGINFAHYGIAVDAAVIAALLHRSDRAVSLMGRSYPGSYVTPATLAAEYTFPVVCLY